MSNTIGDNAAIMGGIHSDSHNVYNTSNTTNNINTGTTNNVVNNSTVYQAQRTDAELYQENEQVFIKAVQTFVADGHLDQRELAELAQLRVQYSVSEQRAIEIIEQLRNSAKALTGDQGNEFLTGQLLREIFNAIQCNAADVLQSKMNILERLARNSQNADVLYYYNLLLASFSPEVAVLNCMKSHSDNYWQLYWAHIAHIKLGNVDNATALLPLLGRFAYPQGDIALLMAIDNMAEYKRNKGQNYYCTQAEQYLQQAVQNGLSDQLSPLWYAAQAYLTATEPTEDWYRFYFMHTLKELGNEQKKVPQVFSTSATNIAQTPPPMPHFNAQNVQLTQMQGFNALNAVNQVGLSKMQPMGTMPQMPSVNTMPQMPAMGTVPQMPTMGTMPNMHQISGQTMPDVPPMPQGGKAFPVAEAVQIAAEMRQANEPIDEPDPLEPHYGMIVTQSLKLAQKYQCTQQQVYDVFNDFIQQAYNQQMYWMFVDIANYDEVESWVEINNIISEQIEESDQESGPDYHLLIIGGDDVIPIPIVENPYEHGSEAIPSDMCYCFEGTYIEDILSGEDFALEISEARNNVSRLPLENGVLQTSIEEDLVAYFNICSMYEGGIPVGNVVMSSNADWIPASATMSEHLPLLYCTEDPELIKNGMYISPKLLTSDEDAIEIYSRSLKKADMLMFNLHGADDPSMPGFYSNAEAFNPSLLQQSNARVLNTVACFGARFTDYAREESMVLNALYGGGVLLYTGSLIPVPMFYDPNTNEARELLLNPGTGSEVLMRLYPLYQFKGMTVGKALLQAKCDYFNMCRHVESDGFSMATILMFSLYGNPMLHIRKRQHVLQAALQNDAMPPAPVKAVAKPLLKVLTNRIVEQRPAQSLLEQVRCYVDDNLAAIRSMAEQYIYSQLGLPPRDLESIDQYSKPTIDGNYEVGYYFNYSNRNARYASKSHVELDKQGHVKRIYTTK